MLTTEDRIILALLAGVGIGAVLTHKKMARRRNDLIRQYNMLVERTNIMSDVFKEVLPQLPDDYTLSDETIVNIKSWTMFSDNNL